MSDLIKLTPIFHEKIWGGRQLETVFGYDIPDGPIGECWAISAHPNGDCQIAEGPYAGHTLSWLWAEHRELFGNCEGKEFPLLIKILDAKDDLSIQIHPNDEYAAEHGAAHHAKSHKGRQNAHGTTALTRRKRLGDDAHIVGHRGGTANALHDTRQDKHLERSRKPAKQRATRKDDHTKLEHIHLAAHIAQAAKRQHGDARREQIRRAHELNAVETHTQLLLHHRKRHRHDARIQTRHKGHDEHGEQNRPFILTVGVALQGNVFAAQLLGSFLHIYPFYRATQKRDPNRLQTVTIGVPPTESEL